MGFVALAASLLARPAAAQLAPTGGHYAARPSDTGHAGLVNSSGGYSASIPLDLPAARGDMPVPVQVTYGERGVGAAGLGWDVPLSYIYRDNTFAHRRPVGAAGVSPRPREQLSLALEGRPIDLVPTASGWVARRDAPALEVRASGTGTLLMYDGAGRIYRFSSQGPAAGTRMAGSDLFLLRSITGPDGNNVFLEYRITEPVLSDGTIGLSINLASVSYNTHPTTPGCNKVRIILGYGPAASSPLALSMLGDHVLVRRDTLASVDVQIKPSCGEDDVRLRSYQLTYGLDADTRLPRLSQVTMTGRQGTPEASTAVQIASYTYGSASRAGELHYRSVSDIILPGAAPLGSTETGDSPRPPAEDGFLTRRSLTDVTGDGRPDLINGATLAPNTVNKEGKTTFGANASFDAIFEKAPFEVRATRGLRYDTHLLDDGVESLKEDVVWKQAIDVNGDGRVDIIDAAAQPGLWVIYLNTPDPADPQKIVWLQRSYSTIALANDLRTRRVWTGDDHLPLARRTTTKDRVFSVCLRWVPSTQHWIVVEEVEQDDPNPDPELRCTPGGILRRSPERTTTEWELTDINGDGYPDVVFNSSPLEHAEEIKFPPPPPSDTPGIAQSERTVRFELAATNQIQAVLNVIGVHGTGNGDLAFSAPVTLRSSDSCGVARWVDTGTRQRLVCSIVDVNGDGIVDRVNGTAVALGTGTIGPAGFFTASAMLTLPGPLAVQVNEQSSRCAPPATVQTTFEVSQVAGLRDLTGDGLPDYVASDAGGAWSVAIATGTGFAPPISIATVGFALSKQTDSCGGSVSRTNEGLYDLDGDGSADLVSVVGSTIFVARLSGSTEVVGAPDAGRLIQLQGGHGATIKITYRSAKEQPSAGDRRFTSHQVPFPEIVVDSVTTTGDRGLGGDLAVTRYAYGGAELVFDPALDRFTFHGYRRTVALRIPTDETQRVATVTDTYGFGSATDPFGLTAPGGTSLTAKQRYDVYLRAGRVSDRTLLAGAIGDDPGALLSAQISTSPLQIGATHHEWDTRLLAAPSDPPGPEVCTEMVFPYDAAASGSFAALGNTYEACTAHGFGFQRSVESWRGEPGAAPPSTANVVTRSHVLDVDELGRIRSASHLNDIFRNDDDVCVETTYANPTGTDQRVLSAVSSQKVTNCGSTILALDRWEYDALPAGSVSAGFPTSHTVERRDEAGSLLGTIREFDATYDAAGNPVTMTTVREDGATRTATIDHDPFGLAPVRVAMTATGVPATEIIVVRDPVTLQALTTTDPNGTQHGATFDGFERPVLSTVTTPGGVSGALSVMTYRGFTVGESLDRSIIQTVFTDPVDPATAKTAAGRTSTVFLDELGRVMRTELALGGDYPDQKLTAGQRIYDSFGRVVFEADPFPASQAFTTAYGTTQFFHPDGTPSCSVRGHGPQSAPVTTTDELSERYPTCVQRVFQDHTEVVSLRDPDSLLAGSPQNGVMQTSYLTAIGRLITRSTWQGSARLEHATFDHDRLGRQTGMTRFQDASAGANPVRSSWRYDSLGQLLDLAEPDSVLRKNKYSDWGELIEVVTAEAPPISGGGTVSAVPPPEEEPPVPFDRRVIKRYDALGRLVHSEERKNGLVDPETVNDYLYDAPVNLAPQVTATHVLGRLARATSPTGTSTFSYDDLGQVNARVFTDNRGELYVEKHTLHADGTPAALDLFLPDTGYAQEHVAYTYDTAGWSRSVEYESGDEQRSLYQATTLDAFGRVRAAQHGPAAYAASYADLGRRLMSQVSVTTALGSRTINYPSYDPVGRERTRSEVKNGTTTTTSHAYDALGRLASSAQTRGATTVFDQRFQYDPLGNLTELTDTAGPSGPSRTALSYLSTDRDRLCRITYGTGTATACNVVHDLLGNIVEQPTRTGVRQLSYFADGSVRSVSEGATTATFRYDAFGEVQELELTSTTSTDIRHDRRYGALLAVRDARAGTTTVPFLTRKIPGPGGSVATRRGAGGPWVFEFGEARGNRFFVDETGAFVQDVDYDPFGKPSSTGAEPGNRLYSHEQWNGGDSLAALGLSHLGARLYDPVIGRFLTRDPLLIPLTAATTNPYAFAFNDPVNFSDPTGLQAQVDTAEDDPGTEAGQQQPGAVDGFDGYLATTAGVISWQGSGVHFLPSGRPPIPAPAQADLEAGKDLAGLPHFPTSVTTSGGTYWNLEHPASRPWPVGDPVTVSAATRAELQWAMEGHENPLVAPVLYVFGADCQDIGPGADCGFGRMMLMVAADVALELAGGALGTLGKTAKVARGGGKAFTGTAYELKHIAKHLEGTAQANRLIAREGAAHVFTDKATFAAAENAIFEGGQFTGVVRGTERFGLMFESPIGARIAADGRSR